MKPLRIIRSCLGVILVSTVLSHPGSLATASTNSSSSTAPAPGVDVIDDDAISAKMIEFGKQLMRGSNHTSVDTLVRQLNRSQCTLALAEPKQNKLTPPELFESVHMSVLVLGTLYQCGSCVEWHLSAATGFALTADGAVATCYHVVHRPGHGVMVAMTGDGKMFGVREVLAADQAHDVAIVRIDGRGLTPLPVATNAPTGSPVFVVSHPSKNYYTFTSGMIARHFYNEEGGHRARMMSITADFGRGSSGCPVFNESGAVIAMADSIVPTTSKSPQGEVMHSIVFKHARPVDALLKLIRAPAKTADPELSILTR